MSLTPEIVLVTGGTGKQGGAAARALLARGYAVRALVRNPQAPAALALKALGADLVQGDLNDKASLQRAADGAHGVFSIQYPTADPDEEPTQGRNLLAAAKAQGVDHFVHTSVSGAGDYVRRSPGYAEGRWNTVYWESKAAIEDAVRAAGFPHWTILKPAFFMENLPFLLMGGDRIITAYEPDVGLQMIAVKDIGEAAAAAIADPDRFHGVNLELAGDVRTMPQTAEILSAAWGRSITAPTLTVPEVVAMGVMQGMADGQVWQNEVGQPARPEFARALGLPLTDLAAWAKANRP
jgi:uncharacterized protein YbjT (DUF2867 family)